MTVYQEIFEVIKQRKADYEAGKAQENSYTAYLFDKGVDKICKKVGEEATETVIAAKNGDNPKALRSCAGLFLLYERIFRNLSTQKPFAE